MIAPGSGPERAGLDAAWPVPGRRGIIGGEPGDTGPDLRSDEELREVFTGDLKPHNAPITLAGYGPGWPRLSEREARRIRTVPGDKALCIEHVGSTSVPGLAARPIIDILLAVADSADELSYLPSLESAGYVLRIREPGWFEHRMFKDPDTDINLHAFSAGVSEIDRMLRFRDWLRATSTRPGPLPARQA